MSDTWEEKTDHWTIDPPEKKIEELKLMIAKHQGDLCQPRIYFPQELYKGLIVSLNGNTFLVLWDEDEQDWGYRDITPSINPFDLSILV